MFQNAANDARSLEMEIRYALPSLVVDEIMGLVEFKSVEKFNQIVGVLSKRYTELDELYERFNHIQDQDEYQHCLKRFFELVHPREVLNELKSVLVFPEIQQQYMLFIKECSSRPYGEVFARYQWKDEVFRHLQAGILSNSNLLMDALEQHALQIAEHVKLLESIREGAVGKGIIKIGSRIAGALIAGPIGSLAARGLTSLFMSDDKEKIPESLGYVEEQWNEFSTTLDHFIDETRDIYKYVLLTLYGGTLMKVQEDLATRHMRMTDINLVEHLFLVELTLEEKKRFMGWAEESGKSIERAIENGEVDVALAASQVMFQTVKSSEVHSRVEIMEGRCLLYHANLYKTAAIFKKAQLWRESDSRTFVSFMQQYYMQAPMMIYDKDLEQWLGKTTVPMILDYIYHCLSDNNQDALLAIADHYNRMFIRIEEKDGWLGEDISNEMEILVILLYRMLASRKIEQNVLANAVHDHIMTDKRVLTTLHDHYKTKSVNDDFAKELRNARNEVIGYRIGKTIMTPIYWLIRKWVFVLALAILFVGLYGYHQGWWQSAWDKVFSSISSPYVAENEVAASTDTENVYVIITAAQANIRSGPGTEYDVVTLMNEGDRLIFSQDKLLSSGGTEWLKVELPDGVTGWISSKIVSFEPQE